LKFSFGFNLLYATSGQIIERKLNNKVLSHIAFLGSTRDENFLNGNYRIFFSELTFHRLKHGVSLCSYHMLMRRNFDPIWSKLS